MDDDTEPPMDGPDASDGDGADASDAGEPRLLESSHRAISDGLGGFVVMEPLRPRPRQLAGHQGLRRGQLDCRAGGSREEILPSIPSPLKSSLILSLSRVDQRDGL